METGSENIDSQEQELLLQAKENFKYEQFNCSTEEFDQRLLRLVRQQRASTAFFEQLSLTLQCLFDKYELTDDEMNETKEEIIVCKEENKEINRSVKLKNPKKRKRSLVLDEKPESKKFEIQNLYPQLILMEYGPMIVIGPNGTMVPVYDFQRVQWTTAQMATRCLLQSIFTNEILATHTLSGSPSPAFRGRERPPKIKLDPLKVADIISCVVAKTGCKEREVRATITTKCSDASKTLRKRFERHFAFADALNANNELFFFGHNVDFTGQCILP